MKRIKRNETIEKGIRLAAILAQLDGKTAGEVMDKTAQAYMENEGKKLFTAEETDAIMQTLQSMPGYAPERLLAAGAPLKNGNFGWALYIAYIMLSITNPELFEDYEEAENGKDDAKD